ncbi:MAG: pyruvate dehydrogenase complex dihydrolipoamide acetyltransferase [Gemmatimonadetes bacterium]|nr:pyruvate dehydrogenase complex dihydrolipoamide acetyltransferase [Gemmatimonadota bacterium]NNM06281.1 pyruvate dehydrogenase complex dihydrolipoamide acetyltransferase [Gemmatimonadota bacterium]
MATKVHMEALSPTMEEGQLVRWLKAEGDSVANGEILAEIETDKATMELVARGEGVLRKVLLGEGGTAPVGEVIAIIAAADEDIGELIGAGGDTPTPVAEGSEAPEASEVAPAPDASSVDGPGEPGEPGARPESVETGEPDEDGERLKASPLARRLAEEVGLDLKTVSGSGPGGRIVVRDVEAARGDAGAPVLSAEAPMGGSPARVPMSGPEGAPANDFEDLPLSQMRKAIAKRLVESISPVPHFFLRITVDMTRTLAARKRVNALLEPQGDKVSINDFVLKSVAGALERHPEANAQWTGEAIRRHYRVHLGVAVAVEDGLITPVIRDANRKGLAAISREIRELAARGREKKLQPEEYTGSTFSVSNLGMFGIHEFTGVINPPEAGILAVGAIEENPAVKDGQVVVKPLMKVTMSCDHRVIDGATGARFLQTLKEMLEEPAAILV